MTPSTKRSVRTELRAARREIVGRRDRGADEVALAEHVRRLADQHGLGPGHSASLYEALPHEPPTRATAQALQDRGIRVLLPITLPDLDLDWRDAADPDSTPLGLSAIGEVDLLLIPGLAVDADGTRLGQGGGCYDKALPRRRAGQPVIVILHPEEFPARTLPREHHDVPVDGVLTVDGFSALSRA